MNFYIKKIQLWFTEGRGVKCYDNFLPDKVNVIWGDSSTGKSSLLRIIDYCLLSTESTIVEDVINQNICWYGLVFYYNGKDYSIIRNAPKREGSDMDVIYREGEFLPDEPIPDYNIDIYQKARIWLDSLFGVPNVKYKGNKSIRVSFRHFLLFNYLTESIIASEDIFLATRFFRGDLRYDSIIEDLFDFVLDSKVVKLLTVKEEVETLRKKLDSAQKEYDRHNQNIEKFNSIIDGLRIKCEGLGFSEFSQLKGFECYQRLLIFADDINQWLDKGKNVELEREISDITKALNSYNRLENEYKKLKLTYEKYKDSLAPIEYLKQHSDEILLCNETHDLISYLQQSWLTVKKECEAPAKLPREMTARINDLTEQLKQKKDQLTKMTPIGERTADSQYLARLVRLVDEIKGIKLPLHNVSREKLVLKETEYKKKQSEYNKLSARNKKTVENLNEYINKFFKLQSSISESYSDCKPEYSLTQDIVLLDRKEWDYPIANIGSQSNYMFLHLCFFLGLHNMLVEDQNDNVVNFLFIDQPSVPYYGGHSVSNSNNISIDDEKKLKDAFKLINKFMEEVVGKLHKHFQIILIEHSDPSYWDCLSYFHTSEHFVKGDGLVPRRIVKKNETNSK